MAVTEMNRRRRGIVLLELDFGSYELGADECRELARILRRRGVHSGDGHALGSATRLEALVDGRVAAPASGLPEEQLDAIADAAWEWLQEVGRDALPDRVLVILDALRSRHAHE